METPVKELNNKNWYQCGIKELPEKPLLYVLGFPIFPIFPDHNGMLCDRVVYINGKSPEAWVLCSLVPCSVLSTCSIVVWRVCVLPLSTFFPIFCWDALRDTAARPDILLNVNTLAVEIRSLIDAILMLGSCFSITEMRSGKPVTNRSLSVRSIPSPV